MAVRLPSRSTGFFARQSTRRKKVSLVDRVVTIFYKYLVRVMIAPSNMKKERPLHEFLLVGEVLLVRVERLTILDLGLDLLQELLLFLL